MAINLRKNGPWHLQERPMTPEIQKVTLEITPSDIRKKDLDTRNNGKWHNKERPLKLGITARDNSTNGKVNISRFLRSSVSVKYLVLLPQTSHVNRVL